MKGPDSGRNIIVVASDSLSSGVVAASTATHYVRDREEESWLRRCEEDIEEGLEGYNQKFSQRGMRKPIDTDTLMLKYGDEELSVSVETSEKSVYADLELYEEKAFLQNLRLEKAFDSMKSSVTEALSGNSFGLESVIYMFEGGKKGCETREWEEKDLRNILE